MIPKIFHLYWSGGPINYFRYLTFLTLRRHHPDWQILLYTNPKHGYAAWEECSQDFHHEQWTDYTAQVYEICDKVIPWEQHQDKAPNFQSDFFRWQILRDCGGWYMDTDQIILKPFDELCKHDCVYAGYGNYFPVGVLGFDKDHGFQNVMLSYLDSEYDANNYNSAGPYAMRSCLRRIGWPGVEIGYNSGVLFYPASFSSGVHKFYALKETIPSNLGDYKALHLFGAHPDSQAYAKMITPEVAKTRNDWISRHLRENGYV